MTIALLVASLLGGVALLPIPPNCSYPRRSNEIGKWVRPMAVAPRSSLTRGVVPKTVILANAIPRPASFLPSIFLVISAS